MCCGRLGLWLSLRYTGHIPVLRKTGALVESLLFGWEDTGALVESLLFGWEDWGFVGIVAAFSSILAG